MHLINRSLDVTERGFAKWLLDIGNGDLHADSVNNDITLPQSMLLEENSIQSLIDFIYPNMSCIDNFVEFFQRSGILAPKNKDVDIINSLALHRLRGATKEYLSVDSICSSDDQSHQLYTLEFLNSLDLGGGYPAHLLSLKENTPVMLLRNLDPRRDLCNGARLICEKLYNRMIEAKIITSKMLAI